MLQWNLWRCLIAIWLKSNKNINTVKINMVPSYERKTMQSKTIDRSINLSHDVGAKVMIGLKESRRKIG